MLKEKLSNKEWNKKAWKCCLHSTSKSNLQLKISLRETQEFSIRIEDKR